MTSVGYLRPQKKFKGKDKEIVRGAADAEWGGKCEEYLSSLSLVDQGVWGALKFFSSRV